VRTWTVRKSVPSRVFLLLFRQIPLRKANYIKANGANICPMDFVEHLQVCIKLGCAGWRKEERERGNYAVAGRC